ncbi:MAG: hypothetical protein LUD84_07915 [Clostridiales bacterium]|nr:hypothetical protein [Clostridiales bacterium]
MARIILTIVTSLPKQCKAPERNLAKTNDSGEGIAPPPLMDFMGISLHQPHWCAARHDWLFAICQALQTKSAEPKRQHNQANS